MNSSISKRKSSDVGNKKSNASSSSSSDDFFEELKVENMIVKTHTFNSMLEKKQN